MKNDKWQFVLRASDFYLSLFICHLPSVICLLPFAICHLPFAICHLTASPGQVARDLVPRRSVFICGLDLVPRRSVFICGFVNTFLGYLLRYRTSTTLRMYCSSVMPSMASCGNGTIFLK